MEERLRFVGAISGMREDGPNSSDPSGPTFRAGNPAVHPKGVAIAPAQVPQGGPLCEPAGPFALTAAGTSPRPIGTP